MDLTKITTPFGLLDAETQRALKDCGGPWEMWAGAFWMDAGEYAFNLSMTYRQKPQPLTQDTIPWAQIDKRFKWAARDEDGECFVYECAPQLRKCDWGDRGDDVERMDHLFADYRPGTCDWRDSLQQRPETD